MALIEHLVEHTYHHTHQIVAYVMEHFGVQYSIPGIDKWLHHNGFSYKILKGVHISLMKQSSKLIEAYNALKASCGEDESILFIDAVHPIQATKRTHGWIRKGQDKHQ